MNLRKWTKEEILLKIKECEDAMYIAEDGMECAEADMQALEDAGEEDTHDFDLAYDCYLYYETEWEERINEKQLYERMLEQMEED